MQLKVKNFIILLVFTFISIFCFSNENIKISILTCEPGDAVYSIFGHSAIRVIDKTNKTDLVYNFGTFDFNTPNFALKFIKKNLNYSLSIQNTEEFINDYTYEKRNIIEQVLNISEYQKIKLLTKLNFLYLPENRNYLYAFSSRNCTTEIRDLLNEIEINFNSQNLKISNRYLIISYVENKTWLKFGINILLGKNADNYIDNYKTMFLPDYLHNELNNIYIKDRKLVESEISLNNIKTSIMKNNNFWISPLFIFSILGIILFLANKKYVNIIVCTCIGLVGLLLLFITVSSSHIELKNNFNILWCNPLYIIYIPYIIYNKSNKVFSYLLIFTIFLTILIWFIGVQQFDYAIIPLLCILLILNLRFINRIPKFFK